MGIFPVRAFWLPVMVTTLVAAFFGAMLARRGRDLDRLHQQQEALQENLVAAKAENARLLSERDALLSSPEAIERVAREEYGLVAPGETVSSVNVTAPGASVRVKPARRKIVGEVTWRDVPLVLTAVVFVLTAVVFALTNLMKAKLRGGRRPDSS